MHPDTLRQLIASCRSPRGRMLGFPRNWRPHTVRNPNFPSMMMTDAGAWELIADYLESGGDFYEMVLDIPPGCPAIYFETKLVDPLPIYVKVQIGSRNIAVGRSFHFSER